MAFYNPDPSMGQTLRSLVAALESGGRLGLSQQLSITWVRYPGLESDPEYARNQRYLGGKGGGMVIFGIKGGKEACFRFMDALKLIDIANNLGDAKSMATHPATTTHMRVGAEERAKLGITDGTVRLSVGLEDVADLIDDLAEALDAAAS